MLSKCRSRSLPTVLVLEQADLNAALDWFVGQADTEWALRLAGVLWHL